MHSGKTWLELILVRCLNPKHHEQVPICHCESCISHSKRIGWNYHRSCQSSVINTSVKTVWLQVAYDFIAKLQVELNGTYITTEPNQHIKKEQNPFPDNTEPFLHSTQLKTNHNHTHVSFVVLKLKINVLLITTSYPLTIKVRPFFANIALIPHLQKED